jgi:uncharacterized protein YkwD
MLHRRELHRVRRAGAVSTIGACPLPPRRAPAAADWRALAAAALLLAGAAAAGSSDASAFESCIDDQQLQQAVVQLNALRRDSAAPCAAPGAAAMQRLHWEARLALSAHEQALDLAARDQLSHVDSRNRGPRTRLRSVGCAAAGAGENLTAGQTAIEDTLQAWMASPWHCANLMQPEHRDIGLVCVQRRGSRYERFWVAHFGAPVAARR